MVFSFLKKGDLSLSKMRKMALLDLQVFYLHCIGIQPENFS